MIVILTDFGITEYLGVMKGVIHNISSHAQIIDLYNQVSPQNIREGAWILLKNYKFFPKRTIFMCIIDPGVGSGRKAIGVASQQYFFIGPDNGLLYPAANDDNIEEIVSLSKDGASQTFHGRDIFAKAAAELENGVSLLQLGDTLNTIVSLDFHLNHKERVGEVVRIDHFGNIITNLPHMGKDEYTILHRENKYRLKFCNTYDAASESDLFLIEGSSETLEISLKNDSAVHKLGTKVGEQIKIF